MSGKVTMLQTETVCGLCGHDPACGYATATDYDNDEAPVRLCHGDEHISCYHLWTVYGVRPEAGQEDATAE